MLKDEKGRRIRQPITLPPSTPESRAVTKLAVMLREDDPTLGLAAAVRQAKEMVINDPSLINESEATS